MTSDRKASRVLEDPQGSTVKIYLSKFFPTLEDRELCWLLGIVAGAGCFKVMHLWRSDVCASTFEVDFSDHAYRLLILLQWKGLNSIAQNWMKSKPLTLHERLQYALSWLDCIFVREIHQENCSYTRPWGETSSLIHQQRQGDCLTSQRSSSTPWKVVVSKSFLELPSNCFLLWWYACLSCWLWTSFAWRLAFFFLACFSLRSNMEWHNFHCSAWILFVAGRTWQSTCPR